MSDYDQKLTMRLLKECAQVLSKQPLDTVVGVLEELIAEAVFVSRMGETKEAAFLGVDAIAHDIKRIVARRLSTPAPVEA